MSSMIPVPRRPEVINRDFLNPRFFASMPTSSYEPGPRSPRGTLWNSLIGNCQSLWTSIGYRLLPRRAVRRRARYESTGAGIISTWSVLRGELWSLDVTCAGNDFVNEGRFLAGPRARGSATLVAECSGARWPATGSLNHPTRVQHAP